MVRVRTLLVMRGDQASSEAHARLVTLARAFAKKEKLGPPRPTRGRSLAPAADFSVADLLFWVRVAEADHARLEELVASFGPKANVRVRPDAMPDAHDFRTADYVTLWGGGLADEVFPNGEEAFAEVTPCRCGGVDRMQIADIAVVSKKVAGWEILNGPGGSILVSSRIADAIAARAPRGITTRPVRDAKTTKPIAMVQLVAKRSALAPCTRHDGFDARFCPHCGRGLEGDVLGLTHIPARTAGEADLLARHPRFHGYLYASRRLYDMLVRMRPKGLGPPTDLFRVCAHVSDKKGEFPLRR